MVLPRYHCSPQVLYNAVKFAWLAYLSKQTDFATFSAAFTAALAVAREAERQAAMNLPDSNAQQAITDALYIELLAFNQDALDVYQDSKLYFAFSFPPAQYQSLWDAAGGTFYDDASHGNFSATTGMLENLDAALTLHSVALLAGGMLASFPTRVATLQTDFTNKLGEYEFSRLAGLQATEAKIIANNQIYDDMISMFAVARRLGFSTATLKQFTFSYWLRLLTGTGLAGIEGTITDAATGLPIFNAVVSIPSLFLTANTGADGTYILDFPSGTYDVTITAPNPSVGPPYISQTFPITVVKGTISTLNVQLAQ